MLEAILSIALPLFLLMDSIGNIPIYIAVLKNCDPKRHKAIILRELFIALAIILTFCFLGDSLLKFLDVQQYTVMIAGGIILFLLALRMIYPQHSDPHQYSRDPDPLIVPLAIPLVAGPAVLAAVMLYAHQGYDTFIVIAGIIVAWVATTIVLISSSFLQKIFKERGITALERLMGLLLTLIAVQMFLHGLTVYHNSLRPIP